MMDIDKTLALTVDEACHELRIGRTHAWHLIRTGELPSIKLGNRRLVPRAALEQRLELLTARRLPSSPSASAECNAERRGQVAL